MIIFLKWNILSEYFIFYAILEKSWTEGQFASAYVAPKIAGPLQLEVYCCGQGLQNWKTGWFIRQILKLENDKFSTRKPTVFFRLPTSLIDLSTHMTKKWWKWKIDKNDKKWHSLFWLLTIVWEINPQYTPYIHNKDTVQSINTYAHIKWSQQIYIF